MSQRTQRRRNETARGSSPGWTDQFSKLPKGQQLALLDLVSGIIALAPYSPKAAEAVKTLEGWAKEQGIDIQGGEVGSPWAMGARAAGLAIAGLRRLGGYVATWAFGREVLAIAAKEGAGKAAPAFIKRALALAGLTAGVAGALGTKKVIDQATDGAASAAKTVGSVLPWLGLGLAGVWAWSKLK